jgi:hypothetical protein
MHSQLRASPIIDLQIVESSPDHESRTQIGIAAVIETSG